MSVINPPKIVAGENNIGGQEREIEAIGYEPLAVSFLPSDVNTPTTLQEEFSHEGREDESISFSFN